MPMLGRKTFDGGSPSLGGIESKFVIPHTKEAFGDEEEYTERMNLYDKKIWTCQCTGHSNHTHLGATLSEASCREKLAQTYDEIWEEPVLKLVHHSFSPLESIVVQANNTLLTTLVHGETVKFTAKPGVTFLAKIQEKHVDTEVPETSTDLNTSDAIDKKEDVAENGEKTDETNHDGKEDSVKSEVGENSSDAKKILNSVSPSSDKENKRQSLITDIFKTDIRRSARSPSTIVRSGVSLKGKRPKLIPAKYNILLVEENKIVSKVPSEHLTRTMKPPNRDQIRLFIRSNSIRPLSSKKKVPWMVNEDLVFRYKLPSRVPEEEIVDILQLCSVTTQQYLHGSDTSISNGHCNGDVIDVDDCDETSKKRKGEKLQSQSKKAKRDSLLLKETKSSLDAFLKKTTKLFSEKIGEIDGKSARQQGSPRKSTSPKKKKQATILELTKKGGIKMVSSRPPAKSRGSKPRKPRQPLIVLQLVALKKEKRFRAHKYKLTITAACKILTEKQRENLPPEVKEDVLAKWEMVEFKRKYDSMSASERKEFLAQRRKEKQAPLGGVVSDKFEDQHLTRAASFRQLPSMELVELPESLPNTAFGNVAMVCEFLHTYHQLLAPKDPGFHKQFHFHNIIEAVTLGRNGYGLTSRIIVVLLQTLLADDIAKDYMELGYRLNQIRVTPSVCCELVRICLRQNDEDVDEGKSDSSSDAGFSDAELSDSTYRRMYEVEIYDMLPNQQVEVLAALAYRVMNTYAVQIHIEDTSEKATTIYKKVLQHKKEKKMTEVPKVADPSPIEPFLVKPNNEEDVMDEGIDLISRVKKRKLLSEKHRRAEEERRKKVREQEERILREQKSKQEQAKADRQLEETRTLARHLRRRLPLGTDRNHSRYWLFCDGIPGFYIEKGWVNDHVDYSTHPETLNIQGIPRTPKNSGGMSVPNTPKKRNKNDSSDDEPPSPTKKPRFRRAKEEVTWPHVGQNLWYSIETQEQLDQLVSSLCKTGIRESRLIKSIEKNYDLIIKSLNKKKQITDPPEGPSRRSSAPSCGEEMHRTFIGKYLKTMVTDACRGGLATVTEPEVMEQRVEVAGSVRDFALLLLELHEALQPNCLKPYLAVGSDKLSERERARAEKRSSKWREAVEDATLYSRLTFLCILLNNSIKWEMYHYQRTSRRKTTRNRNYADLNNGVVEDEESDDETSESNEDEGDDSIHRRSSRLRMRKAAKREPQEDYVREKRATRKPRYMEEYQEDGSEDGEEEGSDAAEEEQGSNDEEDGSEDEDESDAESDDYDEGSISRRIVDKLSSYKFAHLFREPVDPLIVPDYYEIITQPICLNDIRAKIDGKNPEVGFPLPRPTRNNTHPNYTFEILLEDVKLLADNAALYNAPDSYTSRQARKLEQSFVRLCKENFDSDEMIKRLGTLFKRTPKQ